MLKLFGPAARLCDGIDRREMLRIGALSMSGASLPMLTASSARAHDAKKTERSKPKSSSFGQAKNCIVLFLSGGPAHLDTFDPKPESPVEIRG